MVTGAVLDQPTGVPAEPRVRARRAAWWRDPASLTVLFALLVWAVPFTRAGGGRDPYFLTYALFALIPALVVVRPWRHLGRIDLLALLPAAAALFACFVSPTGFDGARGVVSLGYAGALFLVLRGYLVRPHALRGGLRSGVVLIALGVAAVDQFGQSWLAWAGSKDSATLMVGTFFWHNQFATYMAALGLFGVALVARGGRLTRWLGAGLLVLAVPSLVFAASRAALGLFLLGVLVLLVVSVRRPRGAVAVLVIGAVGFGFAQLLASPLLMDSSQSVGTNIEQRETASGNAQARFDYYEVALRLVRDHPLAGTGADSFGTASAPLLPASIQGPTAYVHNGFLQAFVDGGLPLGLAVLAAVGTPLVVAARRLWRGRLGLAGDRVDAVTLGAAAALGLLAAHSFLDMDWIYPSLLALYAVLAALVTRPLPAPATPAPAVEDGAAGESPARPGWVAPVLLGSLIAVLLVTVPLSVRASALTQSDLTPPAWAKVASLGLPLSGGPEWARGANQCATRLRTDLGGPDTSRMRTDLDCTSELGAVAPGIQMYRARAMARLGETDRAADIADGLVERHGARIPQLIVLQALIPVDGGDLDGTRRALAEVARDRRVTEHPPSLAMLASLQEAFEPTDSATGRGSGS